MTDAVPDPTPAAPETSRGARSSPLKRGLQAAVVLVFGAFIVWQVAKQWDRVREGIGELTPLALAGAMLAMLAGIWFSFLCWRAILADFGSTVPTPGAMRIFFVGQAGKYLPGKLWPILTQARLGREYDVPARASSAAAAVFMLMVLGSGLLVGAVTLPFLGADALHQYWWALLALPVALASLWPPVLNRLLALGLRLAKREPMPAPLTVRGTGTAAVWALLMWACYGVHQWLLLRDLGAAGTDLGLLVRATGAFAASWSIGFLLLLFPAGAGPREVALVLMLRGVLPTGQATLVAIVSRLLMTVGDLVWPLVALAAERRRAATAPGPTPAPVAETRR